MSVTYDRASAVVNEIRGICNDTRSLLARIDALIPLNQATAVDWGADPKPDVLTEDAAGNLTNFPFSRQDVANVIYSLTQLQAVLRNQVPSQGDHIGNIQKVADVPVRYPI